MKKWIGYLGAHILICTIFMWKDLSLHYSRGANSARSASKWTLLLIGTIMTLSFFFKEKK